MAGQMDSNSGMSALFIAFKAFISATHAIFWIFYYVLPKERKGVKILKHPFLIDFVFMVDFYFLRKIDSQKFKSSDFAKNGIVYFFKKLMII